MAKFRTKIGITAPASRLDEGVAEKVTALAEKLYRDNPPQLVFHPQCFESHGHFAGADSRRLEAFVEFANDDSFDVLWFGRGGYGSCRFALELPAHLTAVAQRKTYMGYSDGGTLLAALYKAGFPNLAHGPMPADILRTGGETAVTRALTFLVDRKTDGLEPNVSDDQQAHQKTVAFNLAILCQILGTDLQPDLSGHVLMLEEVSEYMYRIDRLLFQLTSNPGIRQVAGIRLGRCSDIPENEPDFGKTEEELVRHWCGIADIPYLGRADIGHDSDNKIVPFGPIPFGVSATS